MQGDTRVHGYVDVGAYLSLCMQIVLPLAVAIYLLASHVYSIDPLLAILGYTETEPGQRVPVNEPYIRLIHLRQALNVLLWTIVLTAAFACLFIFVPGHRL